jgi:predicted dehydrogenase/nucleoside-diphosphate-sugar epimerase
LVYRGRGLSAPAPARLEQHELSTSSVGPTPSNNQTPLRIGLVGTGKMGLSHLRAIRACSGVQIVGVADPRADEAAVRPLLPDDAPILASIDELLSKARPDVIHVVTPPSSHEAVARAAIEGGAHVYVEKPFTLHRAAAESLLETAERHGRIVCAGHQCLFEHGAVAGNRRIPELGSIVHVESYFSFRTVRRSIHPVDQAKDILPHAVYMLVDYMRAAWPQRADLPIELKTIDVDADGGIYAVVSLGGCRGLIVVTLTGRPVEQYLHVVGSNGSMRVDLVSDAVLALPGPGASAPAALLAPYRLAMQTVSRSTSGFYRRIRQRSNGYPGQRDLCQAFYDSIRGTGPLAMTPGSIVETVHLCEQVGDRLDVAHAAAEQAAAVDLDRRTAALAPTVDERGVVLVTGAAGFLGRPLVRELRAAGFRVRAVTRQPLRMPAREPGVDYRVCDLGGQVPPDLLDGVSTVVHAAAETRGGKADQERNSIVATEQLIAAAGAAGVRRFVHVSSVAVMTPSRSASTPLGEDAPLDVGNLERGPYVWGKAESERLAIERARALGIELRIVRLGPLVDMSAFDPPGRLGRELGPLFVAVGPKKSRIALCDVTTAARVLASYASDFASAPPVLNLLEPDAPTRRDLVAKLRARRADVRIFWLPMWFLRVISPPLKLVQRVLLGSKAPLDIASAFTSPTYRTELSAQVIARANGAARPAAAN